ncbi:hypothetical protein [Niveibacterium sp. SC-1]|uniref:GH12 family glycosyl hydrolase domain-containing protein n=1 Tax=Niveibacterium sp. SC-1 TaxID=3135646 RepID=UPI00311E372B
MKLHRLHRRQTALLLAALSLAGCASAPLTPPPVKAAIAESADADWAQIKVDERYRLINNVWNKGAARSGSQRVFTGAAEGGKVIGWQWTWQAGTVVAYPEVVVGDKPWDAPSGLKSEFPLAAGSHRITADFDADLRAQGSYNLVFSLWAITDAARPRASISHEIMIWLARKEMEPPGQRLDPLTVNGVVFDAFLRRDHGDNSGANADKWSLMAFVPRDPVLKGPFELSAFIDYMLAHKLIEPRHLLTSVELGNEVVRGAGTTELRGYAIRVE